MTEPLTPEELGCLFQEIESEPTGKLSELAKVAELDLAKDYVGSDLSGEDLSEDDLSGANFSFSNLRNVNLKNTNLTYSNLSGANLSGANLSGANLSGANLSGAKFDIYCMQFALKIGSSSDDLGTGTGIATDNNSNVLATGLFRGNIDIDSDGTDDLTSNGDIDSYVVKFDIYGNLQFAQNIGSSSDDLGTGTGIATDNNGNVWATGLFRGNIDIDSDSTDDLTSNGDIDEDGNFADGNFAFVVEGDRLLVNDSDDLSYENNPILNITIELSDGELTDEATVTVNLSNSQELTIIESFGTATLAKYSDDTYWIINGDQELQLQNRRGKTYSDSTNNNWDGAAVEANDSGGYRFLLQGNNGRSGQAYVWTTDADGVIQSNSGWKSGGAILPWEVEFNIDLNGDEIIGNSFTTIEGIVTFAKNVDGSYWIIDGDQEIRLQGPNDRSGQAYVWTTDADGVITGGTNLSSANLSSANLSSANLSSANLSSANLSDANLSGANLSGADLSGADLSDANLIFANLSGADLSDADLSDADLSGANLENSIVTNAKFSSKSSGMTRELKQELTEKGAIFEDSLVGLTQLGE